MSTDVATEAVPSVRRPAVPHWARLVVIWGLLITAPFWLPLLGGYTALAGRVRYIGVFWACTVALFVVWAVYLTQAPAPLFIAVTGVSGFCSGLGRKP